MSRYNAAAWPDEATKHQDIPLAERVQKLEQEVAGLRAVFVETCSIAIATHQQMPPELAKWWANHRK